MLESTKKDIQIKILINRKKCCEELGNLKNLTSKSRKKRCDEGELEIKNPTINPREAIKYELCKIKNEILPDCITNNKPLDSKSASIIKNMQMLKALDMVGSGGGAGSVAKKAGGYF